MVQRPEIGQEDQERQCLEQALAGDADAFSYLVEAYSSRIYGTCFSFLGNRQDAEDCVQDAFIKAYRALGTYNFQASFYTWLYRIAVNTCLDFRRKSARNRTYSLDETVETDDNQVQIQIADEGPLPDELAETAEMRAMIRSEIAGLSPMMRQIIVLRDLEGLSYQELARLLGLSEGTVKSRLSRARNQLMQRLARREKRK